VKPHNVALLFSNNSATPPRLTFRCAQYEPTLPLQGRVKQARGSALSRQAFARALQFRSRPPEKRAQGRPGARRTRGLMCPVHQKRKCTRAYRFSGNTPAFPAQWLYDLYVISLVAMLCHHRRRFLTRRLDASLGAPGPHDFAVRECPYVALSRLKHSRPPQPAPTFVTFASAPLAGQDARIEPVICGKNQMVF
jgi:hypothetical protein